MLNLLKIMFTGFDKYGLRHSTAHLNEVKNQIPYWPIERQARYADELIVKAIKRNDTNFIYGQYEQLRESGPLEFNLWNTTTIGNLAYIAIHCKIPKVKAKASNLLAKYLVWHKNGKRVTL